MLYRKLLIAVFAVGVAHAAIAEPLGMGFTYQGNLVQGGQPATGVFDFEFNLFDAAAEGLALTDPLQIPGVMVQQGNFTVELDFGSSPFTGQQLWLGIGVKAAGAPGDHIMLSPRQALTAAPYALHAVEAGGMDWSGLVNVPADLADGDDVIDADAIATNELQSLSEVLTLGNSAGGMTISSLGDPTASTDAANKAYVDAHADADDSSTNELQNLFATVSGDSGNTTADALADTLNVVGAGSVATAVSGDTLTISGSGISTQVRDPVQVGSLPLGDSPQSVFVSGRYAYVTDQATDDLKVIDVTDPTTPSVVGSLVLDPGGNPMSVYVAGRYAYVNQQASPQLFIIDVSDPSAPVLASSSAFTGAFNDIKVSGHYVYATDPGLDQLRVIDVSDASSPSEVGNVSTGEAPSFLYVAGKYAYVIDGSDDDLKVFDISDPSAPSQAGSIRIGNSPAAVYVSGRYAYIVDSGSDDLKVIDVSDPGSPGLAGSLSIGTFPNSVFVSGTYAYVTDHGTDDLKVIDVSNPTEPSLAASLSFGTATAGPNSVYVSGRYAYVTDTFSDQDLLRVVDVSGTEFPSLIAHSLEAGNLQVRNDIIAQGQLQVTGGITVGSSGMFSDGNVGISGTIAIANNIVPTSSPTNLVQLYAEDVAGSSELKVRDEAGNISTLSPHNFSLIGDRSEPMSWSYYSENDHGRINVDMLRAIRLIESLSGEKLVYTQAKSGDDIGGSRAMELSLIEVVEALQEENEALSRRVEALERKLRWKHRQME